MLEILTLASAGQGRADVGVEADGSSGDGEVYRFGVYFAAEPTQLADRLDAGREGNERIKGDFHFLIRESGVLTEIGKY